MGGATLHRLQGGAQPLCPLPPCRPRGESQRRQRARRRRRRPPKMFCHGSAARTISDITNSLPAPCRCSQGLGNVSPFETDRNSRRQFETGMLRWAVVPHTTAHETMCPTCRPPYIDIDRRDYTAVGKYVRVCQTILLLHLLCPQARWRHWGR